MAVWVVGRGALAMLAADDVHVGDRLILASWIGVIVRSPSLEFVPRSDHSGCGDESR